MDTLTVVSGLFAYFLFMWLFRGLFVLLLVKVIGQTVQQFQKKGQDLMSDFRKENEGASMSGMRNDEEQERERV